MSQAVRNERRRLFSTYLNTIAAGLVIAGGIAPAVSLVFSQDPPVAPFAFLVLTSISLSIMFHLIAQTILGGLEP